MFDEAQRRPGRPRLYAVGSKESAGPEGSLIEVTSRLAGEPWTDYPSCVHPTLGAVARSVYDHSSDDGRRGLLPLAPALIGTANTGLEVPARIVATCVSTALASPRPERIPADRSRRLRAARRTALYLLGRTCGPESAAATHLDREEETRRATRMWVRALDPLRLTEPVYRVLVSPGAAAEAVAVAAAASGGDGDQRLSQLLRWCIGLARSLAAEEHTDGGGGDERSGPSER